MRHRAVLLFVCALAFGLAAVGLTYQWLGHQPAVPVPVAVAAPAPPPPPAQLRSTLSTMIGEDRRAITIRVNDVLGVGGFILPGDRVDVLLTRAVDRDNPSTDVLLQNIKVLGVDQEANERKDKPMVARAVTLEVSPEEAQRVTLGTQVGTLSLALRNTADSGAVRPRTLGLADLRPGGIPVKTSVRAPGTTIRVMRGTDSAEMQVVPDRR